MKILSLIKKYKIDYLIFDFDRTITTIGSNTSIGVFNNLLGMKYKQKKRKIDEAVKRSNTYKLKKLWYKKIKLLKKYYNNYSLLNIENKFVIRKYFFEVYDYALKNNIKIIICSSGFKPLIDYILRINNIYNYILFANEISTKKKDIISPINKQKHVIALSKNIVIGDSVYDLSMCNKNTVATIGINIEEKNKYKFKYNVKGE